MNKTLFILLSILILSNIASSQNLKNWEEDVQLEYADFLSPGVKIGEGNIFSLNSGASFAFSFHMSSYEYMFTKNFNDKVECYFNREAASIMAPDSIYAQNLLRYAQYSFDLAELYARKFRKEIYDNKSAFSNSDIFRKAYEKWSNKYSIRFSQVGQDTNLGQNIEQLKIEHHQLLKEIEELSEFCKSCKTKKKKRKKNK